MAEDEEAAFQIDLKGKKNSSSVLGLSEFTPMLYSMSKKCILCILFSTYYVYIVCSMQDVNSDAPSVFPSIHSSGTASASNTPLVITAPLWPLAELNFHFAFLFFERLRCINDNIMSIIYYFSLLFSSCGDVVAVSSLDT